MKEILLLVTVCLSTYCNCPAALLTSFTDDFNRAALGPNYKLVRGAAYVISAGQTLTNGGGGQNHTYLTLGTLPTAEDYASGYEFTAALDIFIPASGQASVVTAGLVLNEQDMARGSVNRLLRFRGYASNSCAIQLLGAAGGGDGVNIKTLASDTWFTLKVSSAVAGIYNYSFNKRGSATPIASGKFTQTTTNILTGGHIGLYTENAPAGAYQFDNFSVTVVKKEPVKVRELLLFSDQRDITNTWGKINFGTTPLQTLSLCENPGFEVSFCRPGNNGAAEVYGLTFKQVTKHGDQVRETNAWSVIHATTRDGVRFENVETVYEAEPGPWTFNHAMAYNPEAREFMLLKLKMDDNGFRYTAFFSPDGRNWKEHTKNPLFYDGDAISLFWDLNLRRFVLVSKSLQIAPGGSKRIVDHGNTSRRVLSIRTSPDGRNWLPSDSMEDVWNRLKRKGGPGFKPLPDALLTVPDELDPPDLEFYSGNAFWHHDRSYMMVLNYAASPLTAGKHAPQMDTEWWVGHDGLHWERPGRDVNALGDAFPGNPRIVQNPMILNGQFLFRFGNRLVGMKQDRISYVGARANAEFSTTPFSMPKGDLLLNAAAPAPERAFATQQAYIMVAVLDESGTVIPGFEADKCIFKAVDGIDLSLLWNGKSARELAGRNISLRFQLRSANIYAVTFKE